MPEQLRTFMELRMAAMFWIHEQNICHDAMNCDPSNVSYISDLRACCTENWKGTWGDCINNIETLNYQDLNNCWTEYSKPSPETKECNASILDIFQKWYFWVIIAGILVIIFVIVLIIMLSRQKKGA